MAVSRLRTDQDTHAEQAIVKICLSTKDLKGSRRGSDADQLFTPHLDMTAYIWGMEMCLPSKVLATTFLSLYLFKSIVTLFYFNGFERIVIWVEKHFLFKGAC